MAYTKQTWADLPSKTTPINANRLTHIEDGIYNAAATADTAASTAGTAAANIGIVSGRVETLTERVNGLDTAVSNKVDKVAGKGLSTNDYDDTDKGKVDSLGTASTKNSTSVVTESSDLVESGAVYTALQSKADNSVIGTVEDGSTASQAYSAGRGFMHNGQFRVAKSEGIASGAEISDSNSMVKKIEEFLCPVWKTATAASGITLIENRNKIIKVGHIVWLSIRFTITEPLDTGVHHIFSLPDESYEVSNLLMNNSAIPYNLELPVAYIPAGSSLVYINRTLPAGTYDVFGTYICK